MALAVALDEAIYFDLVLDKVIEVFFLARPSDDTTCQYKTIVGNRSSCILIIGLVYKRKTIKNIPVNLILMFNVRLAIPLT